MDDFEREQYLAYLESLEPEDKEASKAEPLTVHGLLASLVLAKIPYDMAKCLTLGQLTALIEELNEIRTSEPTE